VLKIYDSLTREKREFISIHKNKVSMYVCGVTVYDYCHIGHARTYIAFDMIYKYLSFIGYKVNYVRNITDIDDKIIQRAQESEELPEDVAHQFIKIMHEDFNSLDLAKPNSEPKATDTIKEIIEFITELINKNHAYIGTNGDVFFAVRDYAGYGQLTQQSLDSLLSGARVEKNDAKNNPLDFVLWKMAKKGEPAWSSPWGDGRPGWHIECSAMATKMLGETIDIHGGGFDLKFPHHENERAQSEAKTHKTFVNYWMHTGFLQIDNEKMSKSLKNFLTIRDVLSKYHPEIIRCFLIMSHYRSEIHYSDLLINQAKSALDRLYNTLRGLKLIAIDVININNIKDECVSKFYTDFTAAMNDDFNTPEAFAVLFDIARQINKTQHSDKIQAGKLGYLLKTLCGIFGLLQQNPEQYMMLIS
jgi:cysteinyl-tRNA synthetase